MKTKRILSFLLVLCTLLSVLCGLSFSVSAAETEVLDLSVNTELVETGADYGLAKNIQDGNILHCFNWKYNDIKAELKNIAEAGFTSVQTSPAQPAGGGEWYWMYQPYAFNIGTNPLGSKDDLKNLCAEADKYGIKVVVDVVANHLNGDTNRVQNDLKDGQYWHNLGGVSSWADRYQVTHGEIGMRDLNSEHSYVQQVVAGYMKELEGVGVDGIRWDAAKHISLPSEDCQFWPAVTKNNSMWHYGEILVGPADGGGHEGLMKEYTNYMSVTDSIYGMDVRNAFAGGNVPGAYGNWSNRGIADNKLVYWGESHDTYSNGPDDWGASTNLSQNVIDRAYAMVASRNGSNALYFSRPSARDKGSIHSGQKGSTSFKNKEVAAVNQLKNACIGEKDYFVSENGVAAVCRQSGAVVVLGGGSNRNVTIANGGGTTKPGTYKDLVSGSTWTVTNSQMSGQVGQSGIAVLLNATPKVEGPAATVTPASTNYTTDTLELTLNFENATSGQYSINGGAFQSFTNGQKITVGKGTAAGTQTKISVKASNASATSEVVTYEYNYSEKAPDGIYFDNSSKKWNTVYCYMYKDGSNAPAEWPGIQMTNIGEDIWTVQIPSGFENCIVMFNAGPGGEQIPASNEPGFVYSGGAKVCDGSDWKDHIVISNNSYIPTQSTLPTETVTQATIATLPTEVTQPTTSTLATDPTESDVIIIPPVTNTTPTNPDVQGGKKYLYGDADLNGKITIKDATAVQKALAKMSTFGNLQLIVSDVNADKKVNVKDVSAIQRYCANALTSFVSGEWYTVSGSSVVEPTEATTQKPVVTDPVEVTTSSTQATVPTQTEAPVTMPTETTQPTQATEPEVDNYIYVKSTWSSVNCHSWPSGGNGTEWPGTPMESLGGGIFRIELPEGHNNVVFNGDGNQTGDIAVEGTGKIWDGSWQPYSNSSNNNNNNNNDVVVSGDCIYFRNNANWDTVNCHSWPDGGDGTVWPGTPMEHVSGNLYKIQLPQGHTKVVFNAGGDHCKTGDLDAQFGKAYNNSTNQWEDI